jgi:hypothetical protein
MRKLLILLSLLVVLISCDKDKFKAKDASFIVVNSASVKATPSQGTNSNKIVDIWYYFNDEFKGVFPIGSKMPILGNGNATVKLFAGIKNNGISATRLPYEFYESYSFTQDIVQGATYSISPIFSYLKSVQFPIIETFEAGGYTFKSVGSTPFDVITDPNKVFEGTGKSFYMEMTDVNPISEIKTSTPIQLPLGGATIYLELNYKCNQVIEVGVIGGGTEYRQALAINPSEEWNKIYIQLTSPVSTQPTYNFYDVYIRATKQVDAPQIFLDNIKLVTR